MAAKGDDLMNDKAIELLQGILNELKTISSKLDDIKSETEWIYHYGSSIDSNTDNLESKLNQIINIINTLR